MASSRRLFDSYLQEWIALYRSGTSSEQIAKRQGTSRQLVLRYLKGAGVSIRPESERIALRVKTDKRCKLRGEDVDRVVASYQRGTSTIKLAKEYNTSPGVIMGCLKREGVEIRSLSEAHADVSGPNNPKFKSKGTYSADGVYLCPDGNGYLRRKMPDHPLAQCDGYIGEHVYQACLKYGVDAVRGMEVHHVDENKQNNSWDNLELLTNSEHMRLHNNIKHWRTKHAEAVV